MKIIQFVTRRQRRGAEVFASQLSTMLARRGHAVWYVGLGEASDDFPVPEGVVSEDVSETPLSKLSLMVIRRTAHIIDQIDPDVVQANGFPSLKYLALARLFSRRRWPLIYRNIGLASDWLRFPGHRYWVRQFLRRADYTAAVSDKSRQDLESTYRLSPSAIEVIPIGVHTEHTHDPSRARAHLTGLGLPRRDGDVLMHVGSFTPEKNHAWLVDAFAALRSRRETPHLFLVGDGPEWDAISQQVQRRGLSHCVHLLGYRNDVSRLVAGADLLVLPSRSEGLPGVVLEAAVQRVPTVASDVGGLSEAVLDGRTGLLFPDQDETAFLDHIVRLLSDAPLRQEMGRAAHAYVQRRFSMDAVTTSFEELYVKTTKRFSANTPSARVARSPARAPERRPRSDASPPSTPARPPRKIVQLVTRRQRRGAEVFAAELSSALTQRGHHTLFAGLNAPPADPLAPDGAQTADVSGHTGTPRLRPSLVYHVHAFLRLHQPDVVQANGSYALKYAVLARTLLGGDWPLVYRNIGISSDWLHFPGHRLWMQWLAHSADQAVSVSAESRDDLRATYGLSDARTGVLHRGVPAEPTCDRAEARAHLRSLGLPPAKDARVLLHVGGFTPEKNHRWLVEVFDDLRADAPDAHLLLVGDGPERAAVQQLVRERGLEGCVHLPGVRRDVSRLMAGGDLLVLPSRTEGIPGVVLEAGMQSTPCVATDVGGLREAVREGETGVLVPLGDRAAFRTAVLDLLNDPARRRQMGRAARAFMAQHFSIEQSAAAFERLYEQVITRHRG